MNKVLARSIAERFEILKDDFEETAYPVGVTLRSIHQTEDDLLSGNVDDILAYLKDDINEYDGHDSTQDHADEAKELYEIIMEGRK